jgi:RND family efflux transporter MFP subunit
MPARFPRSRVAVLAALLLAAGPASPRLVAVEVEGSAHPFQRVTVSSPIEEIVTSVEVAEGDRVEKGKLLALLANERERLQVERLAAMVEKARYDYEASEKLHAQKIETAEKLFERKVELARLLAEKKIAEYEAAQREIRSPIDGVITQRHKDPGESVARVEPIVEIVDSSKLLLQFYLDTGFLTLLRQDAVVEVLFPEVAGDKVYSAKVDFLDPEVDAKSGLFRLRLVLANPDFALKPGLRVIARLPDPPARAPGQ